MKEGKSANQGFTIVELLLAITILGILILPLLNNFITSAKVTQKAQVQYQETNYSKDLLEECRSESIKQIAPLYVYPEDFSLDKNIYLELLPSSSGGYREASSDEKSVEKVEKVLPDLSTTTVYNFKERKDESHYFARMGEKIGGNTYDVLITYNPTNYIDKSSEGLETGYNTYKNPQIEDLSSPGTVVVMEGNEEDSVAMAMHTRHIEYCTSQDLANSEDPNYVPMPRATSEQIKEGLKRKIYISTKNESGNKVKVKVEFEYTSSVVMTGTERVTVYDNTIDTQLKGIYFFYNAITVHPTHMFDRDEIIIEKDAAITEPFDFFVVKQNNSKCTCVTGYKLNVSGALPTGVNIYSNVPIGILTGGSIVKKEETASNKIYTVKVELYKAGENFAPSALCKQLESAKGD